MVVHDESLMEIVFKKPSLKNKKYVIVANHVKELSTMQKAANVKEDNLQNVTGSEDSKKKARKASKKHKDNEETTSDSNNIATEIDSKDLDELRSVYKKCKEVINRIESKYGHLLEETDVDSSSRYRKRHIEDSNNDCTCTKRKKIVFDDEGKQSTVDMSADLHICVDKLKDAPSEPQTKSRNIMVEYQDVEIVLPDNIQELTTMLHDTCTEQTLRNKILDKIKMLKQEYSNEIRFNRHILIEKLKSNCEEVFDFKGTNLSSIPGYS